MDKPLVDKELIQRFYKGTCTEEERALVLRWLEDNEDETSFLEVEQMEVIENRVWQNINPRTYQRLLKRKVSMWGGIAASIALIFSICLSQVPLQDVSPKTYHLGGNNSTSLEVQGLNVRLVGKGNATLVSENNHDTGDLKFCGAVEIVNKSNTDIDYVLTLVCKNSGFTRKNITLKKGKTYIAMHNFYKTDEVVVLRKEQLIEFPDLVPSELRADLSI